VRKVSQYLTDVVLPKFVQDLCTLEVSPMDGQTLTEALHAHGINVRYIGKVSIVFFGLIAVSNSFF
jgi:protein TIF31